MIISPWLLQILSFWAEDRTDREQQIVCTRLQKIRRDLRDYVEDGGSLLAICGGYQLLGHYYDTADGRMEGLSLVDLYTEQGSPRLISNIVLKNESLPDALPYEIVGFENHGGRTYIGSNTPLGRVLYGHGNNGKDACEGVLYRNVIDLLLQRALYRKYGVSLTDFPALDDSLEREANRAVVTRFHSPLAP